MVGGDSTACLSVKFSDTVARHEQHNIVWYPIPTVRKVSALRQRMIDDMTVRNFAPNTQVSYLHQVNLFARHFDKSPDRLGPEEIRTYQIYLAKERHAAVGTRSVAVSALRFLYKVTLKRDWTFEMIPAPKSETRLPVILSPEEVLRLLQAAPSFSHHVIFSTMYGPARASARPFICALPTSTASA